MKSISFLIKDSFIYGLAGGLSKLSGLVIFPILVRAFSQSEYGAFEGISYLYAVFIPVMILGLDSAIARFYYDYESGNQRKQIVSEGFWIQTFTSLSLSIFIYVFSDNITILYLGDDQYSFLLKLYSLLLPFDSIYFFCQNILKWTFKRNNYLFISLGRVFTQLILIIYYVQIKLESIEYVLYVHLFCVSIFSFLGLFFIKDHIKTIIKFEYLKDMLKYGLPYMFASLVITLVGSIDKSLISKFLGLSSLAIYVSAIKIVSIVEVINLGFQTAWGPFSFSNYKRKNSNNQYNTILNLFTLFLGILIILIIFFSRPFLELLLTKNYSDSYRFILPIIFIFYYKSISQITTLGIDLSKKTYWHIIINSFLLLVSYILMNLFMDFGLTGVCYALVITYFLKFVIETLLSNFLYKKIYFKIGIPLAITFIVYLISFILKNYVVKNMLNIEIFYFLPILLIPLIIIYIIKDKILNYLN